MSNSELHGIGGTPPKPIVRGIDSLLENEIKSARILIVDDEAINIELLVEVLECSGYDNLTTCDNPLDLIAGQDVAFDRC